MIPATITTEVLEHADGRPVAYVDATAVAVFAYEEPDGTQVIDIVTREDIPDGRLCILFDGESVGGRSAGTPSSGYVLMPPGMPRDDNATSTHGCELGHQSDAASAA